MKRCILLILCLCILVTLIGCNNTHDHSDDKRVQTASLEIGQTFTITGFAKFSVFKIYTTQKIAPTMNAGIGFETESNNESYIDLILDWTNISSESLTISKLASLYVSVADDNQSTKYFISAETHNGTDLEQDGYLEPQATARLHCAAIVPNDTEKVLLTLQSHDHEFTYDYTLGTTVTNAKSLSITQGINVSDSVSFTLQEVTHTDIVRPSNTEKVYSQYTIDDPDKTYLLVRFGITNHTSDHIDDSYFNITAQYTAPTVYHGFIVIEDTDKSGFAADQTISPMSTRSLYCLIEVPKSVSDTSATITIAINQQEYVFTTN